MVRCADLHIIPPVDNRESCAQIADLLGQIHYSTVGLTMPTGLLRERIKSLQTVFEDRGVDPALRGDFAPTSRDELLRVLRKFRNHYDIVAVNCINQRTATVACRDRRVDVVFFNSASRNLRFTHTFARLLQGALEFNLISDLTEHPDVSILSRLRKAMEVAREHRNTVVLSSGARSYRMVRSPSQITALAVTLGLGHDNSLRGVSSVPCSIIDENRAKRRPDFVEQGVKIVVPSSR